MHYPAGELNILVDRASDLKFPEANSLGSSAVGRRIDPYVTLTLDGKAVKIVKKTPADKVCFLFYCMWYSDIMLAFLSLKISLSLPLSLTPSLITPFSPTLSFPQSS